MVDMQPCPVCGCPDSVDEVRSLGTDVYGMALFCECSECLARFEIEPDGDFDGENYVDCSGVGKRID